jgi:molybdopterin-binding protein
MRFVTQIRVSDAARFLGVSDDTVRRWIDAGTLTGLRDGSGRTVVEGTELAALAKKQAELPADTAAAGSSARNRFVGLVTSVVADMVMAQVELQCGPHRVVSLMSAEAVRELGLEPGSVATAVIKATNVIVQTPSAQPPRQRP